jgi:hypothetical protein
MDPFTATGLIIVAFWGCFVVGFWIEQKVSVWYNGH